MDSLDKLNPNFYFKKIDMLTLLRTTQKKLL